MSKYNDVDVNTLVGRDLSMLAFELGLAPENARLKRGASGGGVEVGGTSEDIGWKAWSPYKDMGQSMDMLRKIKYKEFTVYAHHEEPKAFEVFLVIEEDFIGDTFSGIEVCIDALTEETAIVRACISAEIARRDRDESSNIPDKEDERQGAEPRGS